MKQEKKVYSIIINMDLYNIIALNPCISMVVVNRKRDNQNVGREFRANFSADSLEQMDGYVKQWLIALMAISGVLLIYGVVK